MQKPSLSNIPGSAQNGIADFSLFCCLVLFYCSGFDGCSSISFHHYGQCYLQCFNNIYNWNFKNARLIFTFEKNIDADKYFEIKNGEFTSFSVLNDET